MLLATWLKQAETSLNEANIATARLDSLILLEHCLKIDRSKLLANLDLEISPSNLKTLNNVLKRRIKHEPIAYIVQKSYFYGRPFMVNSAVLEPRPESETIIECLLNLDLKLPNLRIADIGCGCGAIGITAALELQTSAVDLIDIDKKALKVAKINVEKFTLNLSTIQSNLLSNLKDGYSVLLCNLPYVPDDFKINLAATHEPKLAIFGGKDGLDIYRQLFRQLKQLESKPLYILTESLPPQHQTMMTQAANYGYKLVFEDDFIQTFKLAKTD